MLREYIFAQKISNLTGSGTVDLGYWFIQKLLPGGKIGEETDKNQWDEGYEVCVPFQIDESQV